MGKAEVVCPPLPVIKDTGIQPAAGSVSSKLDFSGFQGYNLIGLYVMTSSTNYPGFQEVLAAQYEPALLGKVPVFWVDRTSPSGIYASASWHGKIPITPEFMRIDVAFTTNVAAVTWFVWAVLEKPS